MFTLARGQEPEVSPQGKARLKNNKVSRSKDRQVEEEVKKEYSARNGSGQVIQISGCEGK